MDVFGPGTHCADDPLLHGLGIDLRQFHVTADTGHEVNACQCGFRQQHVEVDALGVVELAQHLLDPHACGRVVEIAGQVEDDGDESLVRVAADEDA